MEHEVGALAPGMAALWGRERPRRGPRPGLSLEAITDAAVALADAEGLAAVSMARVAQGLGVTTMALYRYVSSKDELLALMADAACPPPAPARAAVGATWRERLEAWCVAQLTVVAAHPWIAELTARPAIGPNRVAWIESGLDVFADVPLPEPVKIEIIGTLSLHLVTEAQLAAAYAARGRSAAEGSPGGPPDGEAAHPALIDYGALLAAVTTADEHPRITAVLASGAFDEQDEDTGDVPLGLQILLDGVEAVVRRHTTG